MVSPSLRDLRERERVVSLSGRVTLAPCLLSSWASRRGSLLSLRFHSINAGKVALMIESPNKLLQQTMGSPLSDRPFSGLV